jgi:hypothetical protein
MVATTIVTEITAVPLIILPFSRREKERPVHHAVTPIHVLRVRMVCITVFMQHVGKQSRQG